MKENIGVAYKPTVLRNAINFFRVSPQLHAVSLMYAALAAADGGVVMHYLSQGNIALGLTAVAPEGIAVGLNGLKSVNNLRHYNKLRKSFSMHGWDERPVSHMLGWWCDRYAAYMAAKDEGYKDQLNNYYRRQGRSWLRIVQSDPRQE